MDDTVSLAVAAKNAQAHFGHSALWWRGQPEDWPLVPGMFRPGLKNAADECRIYLHYSRRALSRYARPPNPGELAPWTFFMQHYRLPTRLLDWTESALVAALFAVEDWDKHDGPAVIWALDPARLNHANGIPEGGPVVAGHPVVRDLFDLGWMDCPRYRPAAAAVVGDETDLRMSLQLSGYTIHGDNTPLQHMKDFDVFTLRFEIPRSDCKQLGDDLYALGIRKGNLFPDPENLAREIREQFWG